MYNYLHTSPKEMEITFNNWTGDDIVLELARQIDNGFHLVSMSSEYSPHGDTKHTFNLIETHRI